MFCPNCGRKLENDWIVCPRCSKPITVGPESRVGTDSQKVIHLGGTAVGNDPDPLIKGCLIVLAIGITAVGSIVWWQLHEESERKRIEAERI